MLKVIKRDGSVINVESVSDHISVKEALCPCCGQGILFEPTIQLFEKVRELVGKPIQINSFYRCQKHQDYLRENGYKAARYSPHQEGAALDLALPQGYSAKKLAVTIVDAAVRLKLPIPRIGMETYDYKFVHVDLVFMKFKPYTKKVSPCPGAWVEGAEW